MSWLALLLVPLALYLAYKLVGVAIKLLLAVVVVVALYWSAAPQMGWPTVPDLFSVFGPDFEGQRIGEGLDPSRLAGQAAERVADGVVDEVIERSGLAQPEPAQPPAAAGAEAAWEPLPEPVTEAERAPSAVTD